MNRTKTFILIPIIGLVLLATPILSLKDNNSDGVYICESSSEKGPVFYSASVIDEPNFSTQNSYTFSSMNFNSNVYNSYQGDAVKVAVIDSGLNYDHEDFIDESNDQIIQGQSRAIDNSSGSWKYYQFSSGWNSKLDDSLGHGTNVAACIASQINGVGGIGIAPNVDLYVYKVTNTNNEYEWTAIQNALNYCISEGVDVINMSFQAYESAVSYNSSSMDASTGCSSVLTTYINRCYNAGIVMVAAAGNYNTETKSYPASNNHVISVGSLAKGSTNTKAGYSNLSDIDLVAPGSVYVADKGNNNAYKETQGTSFSSPIVTAAIALYKQKYPNASVDEITNALLSSCDAIDGNPSWAGHGRLNVEAFLNEETISVSEVSLSENSLNFDLKYATTASLTANISPNNATTQTLTWSSSNSSVASVNSSGVVTAKKVGSATIRATAASGVYDECEVTVTDSTVYVSSLTMSSERESVSIGDTVQLSCTVIPNNADNKTLTWTSGDETVATVNSTGLVTPLKVGSTTITAKSVNNKTATCIVTVHNNDGRITGMLLNSDEEELYPSDTFQIEWLLDPDDAPNQNVYFELYEDNGSIIVDEDGLVTAIKAGTDIVTVYSEDNPAVNQSIIFTVKKRVSNVSDELTRATTGVSNGATSYSNWSGKTDNSSAIYAGNSAGSNDSIQLRSNNNNSGIISTTSGGKIKKVTVNWYSGTDNGRTLQVYGKNSAYSAVTELFNNSNQGTLLGTIIKGTSTELTISGDYEYVGVKSSSGAMYLSSITFLWQSEVKTLLDIELSGTARTTFYQGETFSYSGLVVTASYDDSSSKAVTPTSVSTPNLTELGTKTVTVTYTENEVIRIKTYEIEVLADELLSISASCSKSFHPGESIVSSDISVSGTYLSGIKSITDFLFGTYMFTYKDAPSGGGNGSKSFTISYEEYSSSFSVNVSRAAYVAPSGTSKVTLNSNSVFNGIGGSNGTNDRRTGTVTSGGIVYYYYQAYYYNGNISFGNNSIYSSEHGYLRNNTAFSSGIKSVTATDSKLTPHITYSVDGNTFAEKTSTELTNSNYFFFKIDYEGVSFGSNYSNISKIEITLKSQDTVNNVCNYIMYEDTNNQCTTKLNTAIDRLNNMSETDKTTFMNSDSYVIVKARERIEAWAINQGKELNLNSSSQFVLQSQYSLFNNETDGGYVPIVIVIGVISISIVASYIIVKKKRL